MMQQIFPPKHIWPIIVLLLGEILIARDNELLIGSIFRLTEPFSVGENSFSFETAPKTDH